MNDIAPLYAEQSLDTPMLVDFTKTECNRTYWTTVEKQIISEYTRKAEDDCCFFFPNLTSINGSKIIYHLSKRYVIWRNVWPV